MAGTQPSPGSEGNPPHGVFLSVLSVLDNEVSHLTDLRTAIKLLEAITEFGRKLRVIESECHAQAAKLMGKEKEIDLGVEIGVVERSTTVTTKWDHDALFSKIISIAPTAVDPKTGQVVPDGAKLSDLLREAIAPSYWRKGKLKAMGIDPDEYTERTYGAKRVRIRSQEGRNAVHSTSSQAGGQAGRSSRRDSGGTNLPASTGDQAVSGEPEA